MAPLGGCPTTIRPTVSSQVGGWLVSSLLIGDSLRARASPCQLPWSLPLLLQLFPLHLLHSLLLPVFPPLAHGQPGIMTCLAHPSLKWGMVSPPAMSWPALQPLGTPASLTQAPPTISFATRPTCVSRTELLRSYSGLLSRATPAYIPAPLQCTFPRYSGVHSCATLVHTPVLLQSTTGLDWTPLDLPFNRTRT